jgi:hypothetical protein
MSDEFCGYRAIKVSLHRLLCEIVESYCIQILRLMMNTPQTWDGFPTTRFATWFSYWIWYFLGSMLNVVVGRWNSWNYLACWLEVKLVNSQKNTNLFIEKQTLWVTEPLTWKAQQCSTCFSYLCTMKPDEIWDIHDMLTLTYYHITLSQPIIQDIQDIQETAMGKDQIKGINRNPRMLSTAPPGTVDHRNTRWVTLLYSADGQRLHVMH